MKDKIERKKRIGTIGVLVIIGMFVAMMYCPAALAAEVTDPNDYIIDIDSDGGDTSIFAITHEAETEELFRVQENGRVGIRTTGPDRALEINSASGANLRLTYDDSDGSATKYCDFLMDTNHDLTINPSSDGQIKLQPTTDSTDFFQVWNAAQTHPVLNVDSANKRVGIGTLTPGAKLDVEVIETEGGAATIGASSNSASGDFAIAMGANTVASGDYSIAMGANTVASGTVSTAIGGYTTASRSYSIAMGYYTIAGGEGSTTMGRSITVSATGTSSFGIGLGYNYPNWQITQANTMAIMGGKVGIGTTSPSTTLHIDGDVAFGDGSELTISGGVVTATDSYHTIDTESNAASDDLDTIIGGSIAGEILIIRADNSGRTVVVKDGTGNLVLERNLGDFSMDNAEDTLTLIYDGSNWLEISRSDNGA